MSDVALARNIIIEIAGDCWNGKSDMLDRVWRVCRANGKNFTRRRIRGLFHKEAALVKYHEMIDLAEVAAIEKQRNEELKSARKSHAEFVTKTARLASLLEVQDADFHRGQIEAMRGNIGGMDRAGTGGKR